MFYFLIEVKPSPDNPEASELGGAFVSCWIERPTLEEAESVALRMISEARWDVVTIEKRFPIDRSYYDTEKSGLEYFEQALLDKEVFVFDTHL
jgi:hypothetical protein